MSDQYEFQASFKFGPQYKEALINVPANSPEELVGKLEWLTANAGKFVAAQAALLGVEAAAPLAANVSSVQVQNDPTPAPQQNGGWGAPQGQAAPAFAQPAPQAAPQYSQPAQAGSACQHGAMVYREGNGAKGPWKGWFCPTPKNTPGQCSPQFLRG